MVDPIYDDGCEAFASSGDEKTRVRMVFDRGTLVFEGAPRGSAADKLTGVLWDERVAAYRAPAFRYRTRRVARRRRSCASAGCASMRALSRASASLRLRGLSGASPSDIR